MSTANVNETVESEKSGVYDYRFIYPGGNRVESGDLRIFQGALKAGASPVPKFAQYPHMKNTWDWQIIDIFKLFEIMQGDRLKKRTAKIQAAQAEGNKTLKALLKEGLPYVTHTGIFTPRYNRCMVQPGFTFQIDIDRIPNPREILNQVIHDPELEVLFACTSVSGSGIKAMLFLREFVFLRNDWTWQQYRYAYQQVTDILDCHFRKKYSVGIDTQMKAISQPFFLFHAPDLFINPNYESWML